MKKSRSFVLADLDGASFQLSSTAGKVVLLHFFAPWCGACDSEAPILKEIHGLYSDRGFVIVAVAVNSSVDEARAFKERHGLPYRILIDNKVVAQLGYGITTIPTNFFINRDEKIGRPRGLLSRDDFMDIIESLL